MTALAIIALLNNPLVQLGGGIALRGAGYGFDDLHYAIQTRLLADRLAVMQRFILATTKRKALPCPHSHRR